MAKLQKTTLRYNRGQVNTEPDWLAAESPVTIIINGKQYLTLLATPEHLDGLAAGFCLAEGLINKKEDILRLRLFQENDRVELELAGDPELVSRLAATRVLTTGCGKGTRFWRATDSLKQQAVTTRFCLGPAEIIGLMSQFNRSSPLFDETGAVHAAALANTSIQVLREDVARHNAVDKLIGYLVLTQADGGDFCLLTSGRISSELVLKAARANLGLLISRSAPTALAVELAEELNISLLGFVRGQRFNIYTHSWRVEGL